MFAKTETRLSARVTSEEDWQTDVPNIRLSRAFAIVLLMHVVVGASILAFSLMGSKDGKADTTNLKKESRVVAAEKSESKTEAKAQVKPVSTETIPASGRTDDMRRHIVHSGDSVAKIAQQYGVTVEEVHAVNRIDELYQLYQGRVLRIPVSVTSPVEMNSRVAAVPTSNGSNFVSAETPRTSVTVPREEVVVEVEETPAAIEEPPAVPEVAFEVPRVAVTETPRREAPVVRETSIVTPRETPVVQPRVTPVAQSSNQKTYTVVKGDTAYRISQRFNVKADALLKHNGISDPSKLQIGQTLKIPN